MGLAGQKISFLGGGAMGEALLAGLLRQGETKASEIFVSDVAEPRLDYLKDKYGVNVTKRNRDAIEPADIVILALKPFVIIDALQEAAAAARPEQTFISIAAGVAIAQLQACFAGRPIPVIRAMPNTPCLVGEGAAALSPGEFAKDAHLAKALAIFAAAGRAVVLPEEQLDVVTGLSGSGPAYMFMLLEGLTDGAVRLGLPRDVAALLSAQTMLGAAKMVLDTGEHPGKLKDMVTTPGGTTIAGLFALEEGGVRASMMKAVEAAAKRSAAMAKK